MVLLFTNSLAIAATPPKFRYRQLKADLQVKFLLTDANYDSQGNLVSLEPEHSFNHLSINPKLLYAVSPNLAIEGGFTYGSSTSEDGVDIRKNGQISDLEASIYYKAVKSGYYLLPHLKVQFPLVEFEKNSDEVMVNEGVLQVQLGSFLEFIAWNHRFYGYFGYLYQGEERAHLIPYTLGVYNSIGRFIYGLAAGGNFIASDDKFINSPSIRNDVTNNLNGGSQYFYSVNPEKIEASLMLGLRITKGTFTYLKAIQTLTGKNTSENLTALFQVKARLFNPSKKNRRRRKPKFNPDGLDSKDLEALDQMIE